MRALSAIFSAFLLFWCQYSSNYRTFISDSYEFEVSMPERFLGCPIKSWENIHGYYFIIENGFENCENAEEIKLSRFVSIYADFNSTSVKNTEEYVKQYCISGNNTVFFHESPGVYVCKEVFGKNIVLSIYAAYSDKKLLVLDFPKENLGTEIVYKFSLATTKEKFDDDVKYLSVLRKKFRKLN